MSRVQSETAPAASNRSRTHFIVGQDPYGRWLAIETHDRGGGLFKSGKDALHFVDFETDYRPGAFELATTPVQIKF